MRRVVQVDAAAELQVPTRLVMAEARGLRIPVEPAERLGPRGDSLVRTEAWVQEVMAGPTRVSIPRQAPEAEADTMAEAVAEATASAAAPSVVVEAAADRV